MRRVVKLIGVGLIVIALGATLFVHRVGPGEVHLRGEAQRTTGLYFNLPWERWDAHAGATTFVLTGDGVDSAGAVVTFDAPLISESEAQLEAKAKDLLAAPDLAAALAEFGPLAAHTPVPVAQHDADGVRSALSLKLDALEARAATVRATAAEITGTIEAKVAEFNAKSDATYGAREAALLAEIEALHTEAVIYRARRAAQTRAEGDLIRTESELALAQAEAKRDALVASAVSGPGGRYYAAIEAARRFDVRRFAKPKGDLMPLGAIGSLAYWRRVFLGDPTGR